MKPGPGFDDAMPEALYEDVIARQCVIFVGAGVTTERFYKPSFYDIIRNKAEYPQSADPPAFHHLMQYFCDNVDGSQRNRVIREAIERIGRFWQPGEMRRAATRFPIALAEIPFFDRIITTNWDPFLENSLGVLFPIVEDSDLTFWDDTKKQVLKIHGCITRPATLVATTEDYRAWIDRNPLVVNKLRDLITTKTVIFIGYSIRDPDLITIWGEMSAVLGQHRRLAFSVEPEPTEDRIVALNQKGIHVIRQRGEEFVATLRSKLESDGLVPTRAFLSMLDAEQQRIIDLHFKLDQDTDWGIASAMYQDGLLHALDEVLGQSTFGRDFTAFRSELADCEKMLGQMREKDDIVEIAYFSGWCEVLRKFCIGSATPLSAFSILLPYFLQMTSLVELGCDSGSVHCNAGPMQRVRLRRASGTC
jgi:hypothetical protein